MKNLLLAGENYDRKLRKIVMKQDNLSKIQKREWIEFINSHSTRVTRQEETMPGFFDTKMCKECWGYGCEACGGRGVIIDKSRTPEQRSFERSSRRQTFEDLVEKTKEKLDTEEKPLL